MRSDSAGSPPPSFHFIDNVVPPATVAPAEGLVNWTSAKTWGATRARSDRSRNMRAMAM